MLSAKWIPGRGSYFTGMRIAAAIAVGGVGGKVVNEAAALDATTPGVRAGQVASFTAMQPLVVDWALQCVRARLLNRVGVLGRAAQDEISIARVVAHAAAVRTAMVRRLKSEISERFRRLIFHDAAVA